MATKMPSELRPGDRLVVQPLALAGVGAPTITELELADVWLDPPAQTMVLLFTDGSRVNVTENVPVQVRP